MVKRWSHFLPIFVSSSSAPSFSIGSLQAHCDRGAWSRGMDLFRQSAVVRIDVEMGGKGVWRITGEVQGTHTDAQKTLRREVHKILQQADYDLKRIQYNTVVSACMKMLNTLESGKLDDSAASNAIIAEGFSIFLRLLNPVAPHITHALWQELGFAGVHGDLLNAPWPEVDPQALEQSEIDMMIQVNGKLRGSVKVAKDADKATIEAAALASEAVQKFIEGTPKKVIVVPGKLVNIVV